MDPAWAAIVVGVVSSLITALVMGAVSFATLRYWMAKREVYEAVLKEDVKDHEERIRALERGPLDYAAR